MLPERDSCGLTVFSGARAAALHIGARLLGDGLHRGLTPAAHDRALGVFPRERVLLIAREALPAQGREPRAIKIDDDAGDIIVAAALIRLSDKRSRGLLGIVN